MTAEEILKDNMIFPQDTGNLKYERIKKAMSEYASQGREWIEIKGGEMPSPGQTVLIFTASKVIDKGDWYRGSWRTSGSYWIDDPLPGIKRLKSVYENKDITHWMPLPPPPKNSQV